MAQVQFDTPEVLDKKIATIQVKKGFSKKSETILFILETALEEVDLPNLQPNDIKKITP